MSRSDVHDIVLTLRPERGLRQGLKELDDAAAEARDPENFDPTVSIRNYGDIDLPVFTCSSRDCIHLKGELASNLLMPPG
jgi:hypothetical protein